MTDATEQHLISPPDGGGWFGRARDGGDAPMVLYCFAHAGGGGSFFQPWRELLEPEVDVRPVVLPGRETRISEPPVTSVTELVDPVARAIEADVAGRPGGDYAVFGHSMGSVVAYEVTRRLEAGPGADPSCLVVSGRRAPHLPARHEPLHVMPDDAFLDAVVRLNGTPDELLEHDDLIRLLLPTMRADFTVSETYREQPGTRLRCPVAALTGDADPQADLAEMAGWRVTTTGPFTLRVFRGDHFYLIPAMHDVVAAVRATLRRPATAARPT
jgi:surfactin synthase thioesterase subunit